MPLCALQKGSLFMSEKTGMLAHPNTSAVAADGHMKARAASEAYAVLPCHTSLRPLCSIIAVGSVSRVWKSAYEHSFYIFVSCSFISLQRCMFIAESENQSCLKEALENNNLNQLFYFRSSGLVIVPIWMVRLCMSFSLLLLIKIFRFRTSSIYQHLATCETAFVFSD